MSGYLNRVQLIGNLGRDPEVRTTQTGKTVVTLVIATSESWKDERGNRVERTEWHRIVIFSEGLGQIAEKYLEKGSKVYLEGKLCTRKWQDQSGADRYSTEIHLTPYNGVSDLPRQQAGRRSRGCHDYKRPPRWSHRRDGRGEQSRRRDPLLARSLRGGDCPAAQPSQQQSGTPARLGGCGGPIGALADDRHPLHQSQGRHQAHLASLAVGSAIRAEHVGSA
jgi:single-strand DNA-binding protein